MKHFKKVYFLLLITISITTNASVWKNLNQWDNSFELKYQNWVKTNWNVDIFTNIKSTYYSLPTDCADAGYTMRAIFSFENNLPFAINNRYSKINSGPSILSNKMTKWDKKLKRLFSKENVKNEKQHWKTLTNSQKKAWLFIKYIGEMTSTWTVPNDTIPSNLGPTGVTPGKIILLRRKHVYTVKNIDQYGNIEKLSSDLPREVRRLDISKEFQISPIKEFESGLLMFRYPKELTKKSWKIKRANTTQYKLYKSISSKYSDIKKAKHKIKAELEKKIKLGSKLNIGIAITIESEEEMLKRKYSFVCDYAKRRIKAVNKAIDYRNKINGRCFTKEEYDTYSTPSRDTHLYDYLSEFTNRVTENDYLDVDSQFKNFKDQEFVKFLSAIFIENPDQSVINGSYYQSCKVSYDKNDSSKNYFLYDLPELVFGDFFSSDPNLDLKYRWGEVESDDESDLVSTCPTY